jgi:uncharacterized protein (TIGR00730 family)
VVSKDPSAPTCDMPPPAHPVLRREPLPAVQPKPAEDDPGAPARVEAILRAPGYRLAYEDPDFVERDDMRGLRLQLEYQKAEQLLEDRGVARAIVVYGSTRLCEPAAARRKVAALREQLAKDGSNAIVPRKLAIAERILARSGYYDVAREFGRIVGEAHAGEQRDCTVIMTGGGPGIMEAANRGAFDAGAPNVGLNISLPREQFPNPYVTPNLCARFHYFALRKMHLLKRAKALVAFPGGYGTFDELFEVLTLIQTRKIKPIPVVLVGEDFWSKAVDFDFLVDEGVIGPEDRDLFWFAETAPDIWNGIQRWRVANASTLEVGT